MPYFTAADGCNIFYSTYGLDQSNPVIAFLNGTTQTTLYWGNHVPAFSKRYGLIFYDARGQGQSELGDAPISLQLHVADLKSLLQHLGIERVYLIGISHGARVALEFTLELPDMVKRLVLCSLGAQTSDRCRAIVRSWLEILEIADLNAMAWAALPIIFGNKFLKDHHKILEKIVKAVEIRNRKNAVIAQLNAILSYPPPDKVALDIDTPTLIISGSEDVLVEPNDVRQLARLCQARHARLAGIGHSLPAEAPEIFQKTVLEFFDSSA